MDRGADPSEPDRTAAQFEAIVAGWRSEGAVPAWPVDDQPPRTPTALPAVPRLVDAAPETEHFVPPEPPPLPPIGPPAVVGFTLLALGLTLVTAPSVIGMSSVYGLPLGLLALACGLGWLVLRLWPGPADDRDDGDDGAVL